MCRIDSHHVKIHHLSSSYGGRLTCNYSVQKLPQGNLDRPCPFVLAWHLFLLYIWLGSPGCVAGYFGSIYKKWLKKKKKKLFWDFHVLTAFLRQLSPKVSEISLHQWVSSLAFLSFFFILNSYTAALYTWHIRLFKHQLTLIFVISPHYTPEAVICIQITCSAIRYVVPLSVVELRRSCLFIHYA